MTGSSGASSPNKVLSLESQTIHGGSRAKDPYNYVYAACLAWTTLIVGFLLLIGFVVGGIYYGFLTANLPVAHLHRLDIKQLSLTYGSKQETLMTAEIIVFINVTNHSGKLRLNYRPMVATMVAHGIEFAGVRVNGMTQGPNEVTDMKIRFAQDRRAVEEAWANQMKESAEAHVMGIDVIVKGHIDMFLKAKRIQGFPFKIECGSIDQQLVDMGKAPKCNVKMSLVN